MSSSLDTTDLSKCGDCLQPYNDDDRLPKFLSCCHTFCLKCLKKLNAFSAQINCPSCRTATASFEPSSLVSNPYALLLARPIPITNISTQPRWCLTCGSLADQQCPPEHHSSTIDALTLQCTGSLLKFIETFQGRLEKGHEQWAATADKRRAIQNYLNELLRSLKSLIDEVKSVKKENDDRLRTLNALLGIEVSSKSECFFGQFKSFLGIMQLNGRSRENEQDMDRIFCVETPQELSSVKRKATEIESHRKTRIRISLEADGKNIPTCRELEQGFTPTSVVTTPLNRSLNLMTHLAFKVLDLSNDPVRCAAVTGNDPASAVPILVLKLHKGGDLIGEIELLPSAKANDKLVRLLTEHYHNNTVEAGRKIVSVKPGLFVTLNVVIPDVGQQMDVDDWKPTLDVAEDSEQFGNMHDVGIVFITDKTERVILSWQLVFLLAPIRTFAGHEFPASNLFGRIVKGSEFLTAISLMDMSQRGGLVFSI